MGSTSSDRFKDYSDGGDGKSGSGGGDSGDGGSSAKKGKNDPCTVIIETDLEEVERQEYFKAHGAPPPVGTSVELVPDFSARIAVAVVSDATLGFLPTRFNYLRKCWSEGHRYAGEVTQSSTKPFTSVTVKLHAI